MIEKILKFAIAIFFCNIYKILQIVEFSENVLCFNKQNSTYFRVYFPTLIEKSSVNFF
jgi:hypothetical protein